ncbi:MAG: protein kinase [Chloroflexota bacterium]
MPFVFDYGEYLGDMHIVKLVAVLRTAAIYEAERGDEEKILLKVAHDGYHNRLIREAEFLKHLQTQNIFYPALPKLLQAYQEASLEEFPFGTTVFSNRTIYYSVFEHRDGDILRNALLKNRQPWYQHAAWITMSLVDVMALMHQQGVLNLCLCPESVMIRTDSEKIPRPLLLDLGAVTTSEDVNDHWHLSYVPAAYVAPELLLQPRQVSEETDTYGLGLIFYEMLAGQPAYAFRLRRETEILSAIQSNPIPKLSRPDLETSFLSLVDQTVSRSMRQRPDFPTLYESLSQTFPKLPAEKPPRRFNWNLLWIVLGVLFIISLLLVTAFVLAEPFTTA